MFAVDPNITDFKVKEKSVLKVLFSMNTHQVATPDMSLEDARSYVIFCQESDGKISAFIGLHLLATNRRLFYTHSSNPFPEAFMNGVDEEARGFAEGLGAVLDEIDITKMSLEEKNQWIDDQAIFNPKKQVEAKAAETTAEQVTVSEQTPEPATQSAPVAPTSQVQPAAAPQKTEAQAAPASSVPNAPAPEPPLQPQAQPIPPKKAAPESPQTAQQDSAKRTENMLHQAIEAGAGKEPGTQLKKEIHGASGIVSRDKEALARLLSSF
jgi:hypothetical protein